MSKSKTYVIILTAGIVNRFEGDLPRQFNEVAGKPVLMHTLNVFYYCPLKVGITGILDII